MSESRFHTLEDAIRDPEFPAVDLALRKGRHIDREELDAYSFLDDAQRHLEELYRRFGCELVRTDSYFFLLPTGDRLGRRKLTAGEMLVGQALALLYLDPSSLKERGIVAKSLVVSRLAGLVGESRLIHALNFRRKPSTERVAQELVRTEIDKALKALARLGFVDFVDEERVRLRSPLIRFTDAVRGLEDSALALEKLITTGHAAVVGGGGEEVDDEDDADDAEEP